MTEKELTKQARLYLSRIRKNDRLVERLSQTILLLKSNLTGRDYALNPDKVQTSPKLDQLGEIMARLLDLESEMQDRANECVKVKIEAIYLIGKLSNLDQQNILIARYLQGKKWGSIADEINYSERNIYKIHGRALIEFGKLLS